MSAPAAPVRRTRGLQLGRTAQRHGWTIGVWVLLFAMLAFEKHIQPGMGAFDIQSLVLGAAPLVFAAMAQACVVINGGIDLSVGSLISVVNVLSARFMLNHSFRYAILASLVLIVLTALAGALTAVIITISRVPDIVVTLATSFFWAGVALEILSVPGGGAPNDYLNLGNGTFQTSWLPNEFVVILLSFAVVWLPLRWARPGLALYAMGSNRDRAFLSGVSLGWTRILAYSVGGVFSALGGLALTASSGIGDPLSGATLTLNSVAAVVLGGVALVGGRGGLIGPIAAAFVLTLTTTLLTLEGVDQNYAQVIQGALIVIVVMIGGLLLLRRRR